MTLWKALIAAAAVALFLLPLATPAGLLAGVAGTIAGYFLAARVARGPLRLPAGLVLAALAVALGHFGSRWILDRAPGGGTATTIQVADAVLFGLVGLGLFLGVRLLAQRARVFSLVELAVVVAAVAHTFADHRHHHIHQPRFLSDWAWSHGLDPATLLAAAGVATIVLAALMLLETRRASKVLLTLLLLLFGGLAAFMLLRDVRVSSETDTNGLGLSKNDKGDKDDKDDNDKDGSGGSGGGSSRRPPDPVAVAVLHDDLPDADVLYFRQTVLSRFAVDRLVEDGSGEFDRDVISSFPTGKAVRADSPQNPDFHRPLHTSMYLLVDHAQLFGLGNPVEMRPLENPNPRRFVAAYDVDSLFLVQSLGRMFGRPALPREWSEAQRRHYLEIPDDPRYRALSDRLARDIDPRFVGDDVMTALAIKRYLEKEGFYSLKEKKLVGADPTAKFLFGDLRGYCVHFAHAATFLLRSQGIPARVALGYAVQTNRRGAGSSILILGNEAHAWPEMYLAGVGWVTFDIYPERSDEPPPTPVDQDLESMLGELARKDRTGGKAADPDSAFIMPWRQIAASLGTLFGGVLLAAYSAKGVRRRRRSSHRLIYRGILDAFSDLGAARRYGETRERHAQRVAALAPSFPALTRAHLRCSLGKAPADLPALRALARTTRAELRRNTSTFKRLWVLLNPIGWCFTR